MFRIYIETIIEEQSYYALLELVEINGSENVNNSRIGKGLYLTKSLSTFHKVTSQLAKGADYQALPFRQSKLTKMLKPALAGGSKIVLICNISPSATYYDVSKMALEQVEQLSTISNQLRVNKIPNEASIIYQYK